MTQAASARRGRQGDAAAGSLRSCAAERHPAEAAALQRPPSWRRGRAARKRTRALAASDLEAIRGARQPVGHRPAVAGRRTRRRRRHHRRRPARLGGERGRRPCSARQEPGPLSRRARFRGRLSLRLCRGQSHHRRGRDAGRQDAARDQGHPLGQVDRLLRSARHAQVRRCPVDLGRALLETAVPDSRGRAGAVEPAGRCDLGR